MSGLPSWAKVGARVVCIEVFEQKDTGPEYALPAVGEVYTIREIEDGYWGGWYFRFNEIHNPPFFSDGIEPSFSHLRFKPVVEQKSDNEIEAQIYHKLRVRTTARVGERA